MGGREVKTGGWKPDLKMGGFLLRLESWNLYLSEPVNSGPSTSSSSF